MTTQELIREYLERVQQNLFNDAAAKGQKIPVTSFAIETKEQEGQLLAAHYFKYLVYGRGPGKQPPPDAMLKFVQSNPDMLEAARSIYKNITEQGLAFIIGRKIAQEGTAIHQGKKPGIDLDGAIEGPMQDLLSKVAYYAAVKNAEMIVETA